MKQKIITIEINKSPAEVFAFTIDPKNTPLWVDSIVSEKTSEWPVRVGTIYENKNTHDQINKYLVIDFEKDIRFEFLQQGSTYHVKYNFEPLNSGKKAKLIYHEWVEQGQLEEPFTLKILEQLKHVLETSH